MGNSNSHGIYVQTNKQVYAPGEVVSGVVSLNIMNPVKAHSLTLKIKGKEKCHWSEQRTRNVNGQMVSYTEQIYGNHSIFEVLLVLGSFDPKASFSGAYQFPFSFVLPQGIPGTTSLSYGGATACIYYKVKAVLDIAGMLKSDLKFRQPICVHQPPLFMSRLSSSYSAPVTVMCCCNKGFVSFNVTAAQNSYTGGQVAALVASIDNQSSKPFKRVLAELQRVIELNAHGHRKVLYNTIAKNSYPGIAAMSTDMNRQLQLALPPNLLQTALGYTVRVYYSLNVRADLSWGSDPTCRLPMVIFENDMGFGGMPAMQVITAPQGYAPAVQPAVVVNMPGMVAPPPPLAMGEYTNIQMVPSPMPLGGAAPPPQMIPPVLPVSTSGPVQVGGPVQTSYVKAGPVSFDNEVIRTN